MAMRWMKSFFFCELLMGEIHGIVSKNLHCLMLRLERADLRLAERV